jgi:hypothetical protein
MDLRFKHNGKSIIENKFIDWNILHFHFQLKDINNLFFCWNLTNNFWKWYNIIIIERKHRYIYWDMILIEKAPVTLSQFWDMIVHDFKIAMIQH